MGIWQTQLGPVGDRDAGGQPAGRCIGEIYCPACRNVLARLAELRRKDVDPKTGTVRVRRAVIRPRTGPVVKEPKSKAGRRDVFMPDWMLDDLRGHLDRFTGPGKDDLLFPNYLGEPARRVWP